MPNKKKIYIPIIFGLIISISVNVATAQGDSIPVSNQKQVTITSKILNEKRTLWIHLPSGYDVSNEASPVLYLLDGDSHFTYVSEMLEFLADKYRIPKIIVVAILNTDRIHDFTPIHSLIFNGKADSGLITTGGGERFLQFIKKELVPYVDSNYRTQHYRILAGHSLGGLFTLYSKESAPGLFQSHILISPAFYGGNMAILTGFTQFLQSHSRLPGNMFVCVGNEPGTRPGVDSLVHQLKRAASRTFHWRFNFYEDEDHFSIPYKGMYDAIRFIYSKWFIDYRDSTQLSSYKDIQQHYTLLSQLYGYTIIPGEDFVNDCGYQLLRSGHIDEALGIFELNITNHPNSYNVYDSMGEAYMIKGDKALAIKNYKKSIEINPNNENGKTMLRRMINTDK